MEEFHESAEATWKQKKKCYFIKANFECESSSSDFEDLTGEY